MQTVSVSVDTIQKLIRDLDDAIQVCDNVKGSVHKDAEKTYAYAKGYSQSAMSQTVLNLKSLIS